jgi:hypothetical protein
MLVKTVREATCLRSNCCFPQAQCRNMRLYSRTTMSPGSQVSYIMPPCPAMHERNISEQEKEAATKPPCRILARAEHEVKWLSNIAFICFRFCSEKMSDERIRDRMKAQPRVCPITKVPMRAISRCSSP